jgi:uncharacterized protein with HEPN domain
MVRSIWLRLLDIKRAILDIQSIAKDLTYETYLGDVVRRRAIERLVEIVSEASRYLTDEMRAHTAEIPWRQIAAIGNRLRHGYAEVSDPTLWEVVRHDLSPLLAAVERLMATTPNDLPQ